MLSQSIPVTFNEKALHLTKKITEFKRGNEVLSLDDPIHDGDVITFEQQKLEPFIFQDLFKHVEIKMPQKAPGRFTLLRNNQQTTFYGKIEPGDDLKIEWPIES